MSEVTTGATEHTLSCPQCGKSFTKPTPGLAKLALTMHTTSSHRERRPRLPIASDAGGERKSNIKWTGAEWVVISAKLTQLFREDPSLRIITALHRAEDVLPPARRRKKVAFHHYGAISMKRIRKIHDAALRMSRLEKDPVGQVEEGEQGEVASIEGRGGTHAAPPPSATSAPQQVSPLALVGELAQWIARDLVSRLDRLEAAILARIGPPPGWQQAIEEWHRTVLEKSHSIVPTAPPPPRPVLPTVPTPAPRPRRPVVAVVGLFKDQFEHVREKTTGLPLELVFVDKEDRLMRYPSQMDKVIVQRHVSHGWYEKAVKAMGHSNVAFVDGGISGVVQKVYDFNSQLRIR